MFVACLLFFGVAHAEPPGATSMLSFPNTGQSQTEAEATDLGMLSEIREFRADQPVWVVINRESFIVWGSSLIPDAAIITYRGSIWGNYVNSRGDTLYLATPDGTEFVLLGSLSEIWTMGRGTGAGIKRSVGVGSVVGAWVGAIGLAAWAIVECSKDDVECANGVAAAAFVTGLGGGVVGIIVGAGVGAVVGLFTPRPSWKRRYPVH